MKIEKINALCLGATLITSNKTGKNYYKLPFVVEGDYTAFIVSEKTGREIIKAAPYVECAKGKSTVQCELTLQVDFTERGVFTSVDSVK